MKQFILSLLVVATMLAFTLPTYADNSTNQVQQQSVSPTDAIGQVANPEFYAVQGLVHMVR